MASYLIFPIGSKQHSSLVRVEVILFDRRSFN